MATLFLGFKIHILHKSRLGIVHMIRRSQLAGWVVETATCRVMLIVAIIRRI